MNGCDGLILVDQPGKLALKTLYLPRGTCSILVLPGWKLPAAYAYHSPLVLTLLALLAQKYKY